MAKLTKPEKDLSREMLMLVEHAAKYPDRWHNIGSDREDKAAADLLAGRGVIEVRQPQNQFRLIKTNNTGG